MKKSYLRMVRRAFRALRHRRLRHHLWWRTLTKPLFHRNLWKPCRDTVATGLAIGLFFSMLLMPFQMLAAALIAVRFRANVPFAMVACWISNPFTQVPIWLMQYQVGKWLRETVGVPMPEFLVKVGFPVPGAGDLNAASFLLGMSASGVLLALCSYPLVHLFSLILPHHLPVRTAAFRNAARQIRRSDVK
jgi:uncharacterized protein (DUF2062 family)